MIPEAIDLRKKENDCEKYLPISVIIPTYNRAALVLRAVSSALSQCCNEDEVIPGIHSSSESRKAMSGLFAILMPILRALPAPP